MSHRWSGWPGAWCLDCGIDDPGEVCIVAHEHLLQCPKGCDLLSIPSSFCKHGPPGPCADHPMPPCPCPGAGYHDPYLHGARKLFLDALAARQLQLAKQHPAVRGYLDLVARLIAVQLKPVTKEPEPGPRGA